MSSLLQDVTVAPCQLVVGAALADGALREWGAPSPPDRVFTCVCCFIVFNAATVSESAAVCEHHPGLAHPATAAAARRHAQTELTRVFLGCRAG